MKQAEIAELAVYGALMLVGGSLLDNTRHITSPHAYFWFGTLTASANLLALSRT